MKKWNQKGFTLAELLIVVAIIAVLVAIAIPVFGSQLEKSREATDMANIRSAYANLVADYLNNSGAAAAKSITVPAAQKEAGWSETGNHTLETMKDGAINSVTIIDYVVGKDFVVTIAANGDVSVALST